MKKPLHRWKPFAEVFKSSGRHVIAPLASHDAEQLKAEYMLAEQDNLIDEGEVFGSGELTDTLT